MGICKCKKRTELFCFVHKKAVCEQCICSDHQVCVVKSYVEWLQDPDFEPASCGICKGELVEGSMVRLPCLDMFHQECLDVYACSLPPNTAQAGYVCPTCNKPMLPATSNTGPIAQQLRTSFANSPWASQILLPDSEKASLLELSNDGLNNHTHRSDASLSPSESSPALTPASHSHNAAHSNGLTTTSTSQFYNTSSAPPPTVISVDSNADKQNVLSPTSLYGVSSRKAQTRTSPLYLDDEDEDKYKRKGIMQLFSALGLVSRPTATLDGKRGMRVDPRRLLVLFALLASFTTVVVLYLVVLDTQPITEEE